MISYEGLQRVIRRNPELGIREMSNDCSWSRGDKETDLDGTYNEEPRASGDLLRLWLRGSGFREEAVSWGTAEQIAEKKIVDVRE